MLLFCPLKKNRCINEPWALQPCSCVMILKESNHLRDSIIFCQSCTHIVRSDNCCGQVYNNWLFVSNENGGVMIPGDIRRRRIVDWIAQIGKHWQGISEVSGSNPGSIKVFFTILRKSAKVVFFLIKYTSSVIVAWTVSPQ